MQSPISDSLQHVYAILKKKAESLAVGSSRLSLSAELTQEICSLFYSSTRSPSISDLNALISNVRALRINPDHCPSSILPSVYLGPFHNLTYLEVRHVDIYNVIHLSKLRSQLKHLVLVSCINSLDDLLWRCGGDKCSDSFIWAELNTLHVTCCDCLQLDNGLQLTPWLKILDLSFNALSDHSISSLDTIFSINQLILNFNRLLRVPTLAVNARSSLKILHLRHNQLESLKGLELLCSLEEVDVAYNCLSNQDAVLPLSCLPYLVNLCLEFNPISVSKDYRVTVLQRVNTAVNKKRFQLDGQYLSAVEKDVVGTMAVIFSSTQLSQYYETSIGSSSSPRRPTATSLCTIQVQSEENNAVEGQGLLSTCSRTPTNSIEALANVKLMSSLSAKRRRPVRMREAEIVDSNLAAPISLVDETPQPLNEDEEHLATKQQLEELRRTFGQDNWLHSQAGDQVRQLLGWEEDVIQHRSVEEALLSSNSQPKESIQPRESGHEESAIIEVNGEDKEESIEVLASSRSIDSSTEEDDTNDSASDHVFVVRREVDGVYVERLLTVSRWSLCEKDVLSGATLSSWKMPQLKSVEILERQPQIRLQLTFVPASQSCRNRVYVMEENDFTEFESLITLQAQPNGNNEIDLDALRCIKCNQEFPKIRAKLKLRTSSTVALKGQLEEYPVCPYCESDVIFAIDQQPFLADESIKTSDLIGAVDEPSKLDRSSGSSDTEANGDSANSGDSEGSVEVMDKSDLPSNALAFAKLKSGPHGSKSLKSTSSRSTCSHSSQQSKTVRHSAVNVSQFSYSYADFSQVDHRLRLYCEMFLTSHQTEEFLGLIKADLVTSLDSEQPGLLVVTSRKLYFLKIIGEQSEQPEKWLQKEASHPLSQLCCVMTIIGNQGLVLQLDKEGSVQLYLILLRDERRTKNVLHFLLSSLEKSGLQTVLVDMMPMQWMALEGLVRGDVDDGDGDGDIAKAVEETDLRTNLFLFCTSAAVAWKNHKVADDNASVMVFNDQVALIRSDPRWLLSNNIQFRTWGVSLLSVQQVVNLVSLESVISHPEELRLSFLDEASGSEERWTIRLMTREAVDQLVEALRNPWEAMFSVELEITELDE